MTDEKLKKLDLKRKRLLKLLMAAGDNGGLMEEVLNVCRLSQLQKKKTESMWHILKSNVFPFWIRCQVTFRLRVQSTLLTKITSSFSINEILLLKVFI